MQKIQYVYQSYAGGFTFNDFADVGIRHTDRQI